MSEAYRPKFKGVSATAAGVATAVSATDKATLPRATDVKKFDTFPPGQAATNSIPNPKPGGGLSHATSKAVMAGKSRNCETTPANNDRGAAAKRRNSDGRVSKATPNIISAKVAFRAAIPEALKFNRTSSQDSIFAQNNELSRSLFCYKSGELVGIIPLPGQAVAITATYRSAIYGNEIKK
jgi:hypothetical protein